MFPALVSVVLLATAVATRALAFRSARARSVLYAALCLVCEYVCMAMRVCAGVSVCLCLFVFVF